MIIGLLLLRHEQKVSSAVLNDGKDLADRINSKWETSEFEERRTRLVLSLENNLDAQLVAVS